MNKISYTVADFSSTPQTGYIECSSFPKSVWKKDIEIASVEVTKDDVIINISGENLHVSFRQLLHRIEILEEKLNKSE